jgi:hypothetical protein
MNVIVVWIDIIRISINNVGKEILKTIRKKYP